MNIDLEIHPDQQAWFTTQNIEHEFEVRVNATGKGVSSSVFQRLLSTFTSSYTSQYEEYEHVSHSDPLNKKKQEKEYRMKKGVETMSKQSLRKHDIQYIGFSLRISEAIETTERKLPTGYKATFSRYIKRTSFTRDRIRIDCSQVTNSKLTEPKDSRTSFDTFEVEIEYTPAEANVVFFDDVYPVLKHIIKVLHQDCVLPPVPRMVCLQKEDIKGIMSDLQSKVGKPLNHDLRGQAINIKARHFANLNTYALTNKLDGERKMIFTMTRPTSTIRWAYIMNATGPKSDDSDSDDHGSDDHDGTVRLDTFYAVPMNEMDSTIPHVLVDCEYDHGVYYMFDVLYCDETTLRRLRPEDTIHHRERMARVEPEWFSFPFQKKKFYYGNGEKNIMDLIHDSPDPKQFFEQNDGFIFTYPTCSYMDTTRVNRYPNLKYKFSAKLAIDFYIDYTGSTPEFPFLYNLYSDKKHKERCYRIQPREQPREQPYGTLQSITELQNHAIVECIWYQQKWVMLRYRHDRVNGNKPGVVKDNFQDMENPISLETMFPFPSVQPYIRHLEYMNHTFVTTYFQESLLSFLYMTIPVVVVLRSMCYTLDIPDHRAIVIRNRWLELAKLTLPSDYTVLQVIASILPFNERILRYTKNELDYINGLYAHIFPHDTTPTIFDVRSFSLMTLDHQLTRHNHGWVSKRSPSRLLEPMVAKPGVLTRFSRSDIQKYPKYQRFTTVVASEYSSLKPWEEPQVKAAYEKWFRYPERVKRVVDATAHVGVDTVHLATVFPRAHLDAFELVPEHAVALQKNVKEFKIEDRVTCHYQDATTWMPSEPIDLVYVDPPWGGPDYKEKSKLDLYMQSEKDTFREADKNINYIVDQWMSTGKIGHIVLKVPFNFTKTYLMNRYKVEEVAIYDQTGQRFAYGLLHIEATIPFLYKPKSNLTVWSVPYVANSYEPLFINTNSVLVRLPRYNDPTEWIQTRLYYNRFQPFSYERPVLIELDSLVAYAAAHGFQTNGQYIELNYFSYLFFTKVAMGNAQEETGALQDMRKYHNLEKKYIIKQYAQKKSVLDLGSGFGGDLFKYEEVGVTRLIAVEPSQANMLTLKNRLDSTSTIQYVTTLVNAVGQDWDSIQPYVRDRVDVVSSFFSMTFLFESIEILRGFLHTVDQSMVEGGYFMGTMMSGEKTYALLEKIKKDGTLHLGKDMSLTKRYDNQAPSTGMALHINLNETIVGLQHEYLAFFSILKQEMEQLGFVLVTQYDFNPPAKLAPYEITFSQLNIGFVFQKLPKGVTYSTPLLAENDTYEFMNLYGESQVLVRTGVQHNTYSFYHSYLYNTSHPYRQASRTERETLAKQLHQAFVAHHKSPLRSDEMTPALLEEFMDMTNVNVYWVDTVTRRPMKTPGIKVTRDFSILMVHHEKEFEPLAVLYEKEAVRLLPKMNQFLVCIHRARQ
jgi:hypothetical protein